MRAARNCFGMLNETVVFLGLFSFSSIRTYRQDKIIVCSSMLLSYLIITLNNAYLHLGLAVGPFHNCATASIN